MHEHEWVLEFLGLDMHAWEYQKKKKKKNVWKTLE